MSFEEGYKKWLEEKEKKKEGNHGSSFDDGYTEWLWNKNGQKIVDELNSRVDTWLKNNDNYVYNARERFKGNNTTYRKDSGDWLATITTQKNNFDKEAENILSLVNQYKNFLKAEDVANITNALNGNRKIQSDILSQSAEDNKFWSKFETEDAYNDFVKSYKIEQDYLKYDIDAGRVEIGNLQDIYDTALGLQQKQDQNMMYDPNRTTDDINAANAELQAQFDKLIKPYGGLDALKNTIAEKIAYLNRAKYKQECHALESVSDPNSENYDPNFSEYASKGAGVKNPTPQEAERGIFSTPVENIVTYSREHWQEIAFAEANGNTASSGARSLYRWMKDDEVAVYNYYLGKGDKKSAEEYLKRLEETLNGRQGSSWAESMDGSIPLQYLFGVVAGLDQFGSGMKSLFSTDDYIPASSYQQASAIVREDLKDDGFKIFGNSIGQIGYDAITTISNQAPSILASIAANYIAPGSGAIVGNIVLGASAAGNAYAEAINYGFDKGQARSYSTMVGASEALVSYLLGGISALGGKVSGNAVSKVLSKVDNTYARAALKLGGNMFSEGLEESIQEVLDPWFKHIATGVDYDAPDIDQVLYSGLLGALSAGVLEGVGTVSSIGKSHLDTKKQGKALLENGLNVDRLKALGTTFSADTVAYKLANKVNAKTGAYKIAKLFNAVGAELTASNQADIVKSLTRKGIAESHANTIAKYLAATVAGAELDITQITALEQNQDIADTFRDVIINQNSTVNQRVRQASNLFDKNATAETATQPYDQTAVEAPVETTETAPVAAEEAVASVAEDNSTTVIETQENGQHNADTYARTIRKDTGEAIEIDEIQSIENGRMTLRLKDGKSIDYRSVEFNKQSDAVLYETVQKMDVNAAAANALIKAYDGTSDVDVYSHGIQDAFRYGKYTFPKSDLVSGEFTSMLAEFQRNTAYRLGQQAAETEAAKNTAVVKTKGKGTVTYANGINKAELSTRQKTSIEVMERIAEILGVNVHLYESKPGPNNTRYFIDENGKRVMNAPHGYYINGEIYIDTNAGFNGEQVMLFTFSHELAHHLRAKNKAQFKALADFLMQEYGKKGVSVEGLVQTQLEDVKKTHPELSYNEQYDIAYEEFVADSLQTMFTDGNLLEKLEKLKAKNKSLWETIKDFIAKFADKIRNAYKGVNPYSEEGKIVSEMKESIEQIAQLFAEGLASTSANFELDSIYTDATEVSTDAVAVEDTTRFSYRSLAQAAGFEAREENGVRGYYRNGAKVSEVTVDDIEISPIGAMINYSLDMGDISEADAEAQKKLFADICTLACKTNDFSMTMQFVGSAVFTAMKANADKQYGTTYDFTSICTKTQAVIDSMSAKMVAEKRGLSPEEILEIYDKVFADGNPVPCSECYVFSRWVGIGGLLDNIYNYQTHYGSMGVDDVVGAYSDLYKKVQAYALANGITPGKAKGALVDKVTKTWADLKEKIDKADNQGERVSDADRARLKSLENEMVTVKALAWLTNVYFAEKPLDANGNPKANPKVNKNFSVPAEVLFDLNRSEEFASQYREVWGFRTTQGAGYGKAITPYAEAVLGEGILGTNNTTNTIKSKAKGSLSNPFLDQRGMMDKNARKILAKARLKQKIQAFLGGQRFQSTSDARYENASDYLLAALEMQAMHGRVQVYTKVDGAVAAFDAWGFSSNQSLMPLGGGIDAKGNVIDTAFGGMNRDVAFRNRKKHETAGTITIGVNDNHIRKLFADIARDLIIPYHASGGKAWLVNAFRMVQDRAVKKNTFVRSTDYSRTQSDKVLSDEVLSWLGKSAEEIAQIHAVRNARIAILTGGNPDMDVVKSNRFLSALYDKFHGGEWDGVKLAKGKVESQIFPNEFWDKSVTYENSGQITQDYLDYCADLGFLHRFSGKVPKNGILIPVTGYNERDERVQLTDLAYKVDANGNQTSEIEPFFWKVLTDRRMYGNDGQYIEQKVVTLSTTKKDTITNFAKNNTGRQYDAILSHKTAEEVAGTRLSARTKADADTVPHTIASDFITHIKGISDSRGWYTEDVTDYIESHPELNFVERIFSKDKAVKADLATFLNEIGDPKLLDLLSWYIGEAYSDKGRVWSRETGKATYPYRGSVRTFRNAIKNRINAIMTEKNNGTNLGVKNGEVSITDVENLFYRLNSNEEIGELAEKVFSTAKKLGVNIRFTNQTFRQNVAGVSVGDMVEYKTSYFNNTAVADQKKGKTILHELIHSCTVYVLSENRSSGDVYYRSKPKEYERIANAATRLNRIFNEISDDPAFEGKYGAKNVREMVAELANEDFVGLLKEKSLWEKVLDFICELFGYTRGNTAYDNARLCVDYILDNPDVTEYRDYARRQRSAARSEGLDTFGYTLSNDTEIRYSSRKKTTLNRYNSNSERLSDGQYSFFKDSQAVNEEGRLIPLYHGTENGGFTVFDPKYSDDGISLFLTDSLSLASTYSGTSDRIDVKKGKPKMLRWTETTDPIESQGQHGVYKVYANITNPLVIDAEGGMWHTLNYNGESMSTREIAHLAKAEGYDGVIIRNVYDGGKYRKGTSEEMGTVYIVFDSNQIKDVNNTNPTANKDIRYSQRRNSGSSIDNYTEEQYNAFGWASYNRVITAHERETLFSRYADFMHNRDKYPVTRWGEAVIHSTECPDVIIYVKGTIKSHSITRVIRIVADSSEDISIIRERIVTNEFEQKLSPYEAITTYYGEEYLQFSRKRDYASFLEYQARAKGRSGQESNPTVEGLQNRGRSDSGSIESNRGDDGVTRSSSRKSDGLSNRALLANALESTATDESSLEALRRYKKDFARIDELETALFDIYDELDEIRETQGRRITAEVKALQDEAARLEAEITRLDKKLIRAETGGVLASILEREKAAVSRHYQDARKRNTEGRHKTIVRNKIKRTVKELDRLLNRGNRVSNVKAEVRDTVSSALKLSSILFSEEITNEDIVLAGAMSATDAEMKLLNEYTQRIKQRDEAASEEVRDLAVRRMAILDKKLADLFARERARLNRTSVKDALNELSNAYGKLKSADSDYVEFAYEEAIHDRLRSFIETLDGTVVKDMSRNQLEEILLLYRAIEYTVRESNSLFKKGQTLDRAKTTAATQKEILSWYKHPGRDPLAIVRVPLNAVKGFAFKDLKPVAAFETLGSETYMQFFWDVIKAEGKWARIVDEAATFLDEQVEKSGYTSWNMEERHTFTLPSGQEFNITLQDMMSIYAYSKRDQAYGHMTVGGFQFPENSTYEDVLRNKKGEPIKGANGKEIKVKRIHLSDTYTVDDAVLAQIIKELEDMHEGKVKEYVDAVQSYITEVLAAKGNEVSRVLFGIDLFGEKSYMPLKSSSDFLTSTQTVLGKTQTVSSLKNIGMSKATVPNAENPIVLQGFDQVVQQHIDEMAKYCAYVLPIENLRRVFDSVAVSDNGREYISTKNIISRVYGKGVSGYFEKYITDLNGGTVVKDSNNLASKMFSNFKAVSVAASLSVVVQQPFAVTRAAAMISPKYFVFGENAKTDARTTYEEIKRYAPVAIIKEMGGFDMGNSRTAVEYLQTRTDKGIKRGFDEVRDKSMWMAGQADEFGWGIIWDAVKREMVDNGNLTPGTEEFFEACGERFTEVIVYTQVYDSVNSRSDFMRSQNDTTKYWTSFMGEPTTTINMAYLSLLRFGRATKAEKAKAIGGLAKVTGVLLVNSLLTTLAKSFVYAMRDDEDDEAFLERWAKHFGDNVLSDLNPLNMLPLVRDIMSIIEGWDVERPDTTLISAIVLGIKNLLDGDATVNDWLNFAGSVGNMLGLPVKNIIRDANGIINLFGDVFDDIHPNNIGGAFVEGITGKDPADTDKLYRAIVTKDTGRLSVLKEKYKSDEAYNSALKKAIRDNDQRVKKAASALMKADYDSFEAYISQIAAEGFFDQEFVEDAIRSEARHFNSKIGDAYTAKEDGNTNKHNDIVRELRDRYRGIISQDEIVAKVKAYTPTEETEETEQAESIFKTSDINAALESGNTGKALEIIDDLIKVKTENYIANGEKKKDAENKAKSSVKSSVTSYWKPLYQKAYLAGDTNEMSRITQIIKGTKLYTGLSDTLGDWRKSAKDSK